MDCVCCGSAAVAERPERTARGYRRFRCRDCGKQFNERSGGLLNRTQYPSDGHCQLIQLRAKFDRMAERARAHAAIRTHVSCCQVRKALARAQRY